MIPSPDQIPPGTLPPECLDALGTFSEEERSELGSYYRWETGEFIGIGFIGPGGKFCRYADNPRAWATDVLEKRIIYELKLKGTHGVE